MPAYSEFLGDYSAAGVSRTWWPEKYHTGSAIFIAGSDTVPIQAGSQALAAHSPVGPLAG